MTMRPSRNWPALGGILLGVGGVVSYFALVLRHDPRLRWMLDIPLLNLALVVAGLLLSLVGVRQALRRRRTGQLWAPLLALLNFGLAGAFGWYLFAFSYHLPPATGAPAVGTPAPDFELLDEHGSPVRLSSFRGRGVVLLFYRGFW
jgi:hypothetical protein